MLRAKALHRLKIVNWRRLFSKVRLFGQVSRKFANEQERLEYQNLRQHQKAEASMKYRPF